MPKSFSEDESEFDLNITEDIRILKRVVLANDRNMIDSSLELYLLTKRFFY